MKPFAMARPTTELQAVDYLSRIEGPVAFLAGGTDLISLMRAGLVSPSHVIDLKSIPTLNQIEAANGGIQIGATVTLAELQRSKLLRRFQSLQDAIDGIRAIQILESGTIGGDLCHLPNCWFFRSGYGLSGIHQEVSLPEVDDNRYHAIFGNHGAAKFVCASRLAPALIAWGAKVRVVGPSTSDARAGDTIDAFWIPLERLYASEFDSQQRIFVLQPTQFISHIWIPEATEFASATYEVMPTEGLDWPLAAASVCIQVEQGTVRDCRIILGHVAPMPWNAEGAARYLVGCELSEQTAAAAAAISVESATPLSMNGYKVDLTRTVVKRALLNASKDLSSGKSVAREIL